MHGCSQKSADHLERRTGICTLIYNDKHWKNFFELIGQSELLERDPRFADLGSRAKHINELYRLVADVLVTRSTSEWLIALDKADIPVMPLRDLKSVLDDPHLKAIGFFEMVNHPTEGRIRSMAVPSTWSKSQPRATRHAPRLGEHSIQVLREMDFSEQEIATMLSEKSTMSPECFREE